VNPLLETIQGGDGSPAEPDWTAVFTDILDIQAAREQWRIVVRELHESQALTVANGHTIRRLVEFRVIYERAVRDMAETGAVMKAKRSRVPQVNPNWPIMRQASEHISSLEAELCLTPRRRAAAGRVQRKAKVVRPADAYLKSVPK
jgi:P27 family predicted phage terminase small subunit